MSKGMTLIEVMVAVAVLAILASVAAPAMGDFFDRRRLIAEIEGVSGLIQLARSEVLRRSAGGGTAGFVSVTVQPGSAWHVGLSNGESGCADPDDCTLNESGADIKRVWQNTSCSSCSMVAPEENAVFAFTLRGVLRGGDAAQTITIQSPKGKQLSIAVSALGRVSICSPNGVVGYPSCT